MMKTLIAALMLSSLSAPAAMAMDGSVALIVGGDALILPFPGMDDPGRRSGRCPKHGAAVAHEGSACGGV